MLASQPRPRADDLPDETACPGACGRMPALGCIRRIGGGAIQIPHQELLKWRLVTFLLTQVPVSDTDATSLAQLTGRQPGDAGGRGECGSRGRRLVTTVPGRLRENARPAP